MPSIPMLIDAGRTDIAQAILRVGGAQEAAKMLGMATIRNPKGFWSREERVVAAALQFVAEKHGVGTDRLSEDLTLQAAGARAQFDELREVGAPHASRSACRCTGRGAAGPAADSGLTSI